MDQVIEGGQVTSVAVKDGLVAVAVKNPDANAQGFVALFDADGRYQGGAEVGVGPDHVTFTPDGTRVLTVNEGETTDEGDPISSVSVVDVSTPGQLKTSTEVDFSAFDGKVDELRQAGVRLFPDKLPSEDFEPEYLSVAPDGKTAMVTLQENNAVAILDLETKTFTDVEALGLKDHSQPGNGLDASDDDGQISIVNWPVFGMYMPDNVASFQAGGATYYVIANEGDDRGEDERIKDLELDPTAFPKAGELQADEQLGRLGVSTIDGDTDGDGDRQHRQDRLRQRRPVRADHRKASAGCVQQRQRGSRQLRLAQRQQGARAGRHRHRRSRWRALCLCRHGAGRRHHGVRPERSHRA
jgi:DNA-binding beta-propeller fold protein YncE